MSTSQLAMLTGLAKDARDQAGKVLAQERQTEQQTTAQLQSLLSYRAEYAERLQKAMRDGIDPATMYNYQQFLASLDAALSRARQALAAQQASVQQSQRTGNRNSASSLPTIHWRRVGC
ncbi:hypothetical protein HSBAA_01750 [Vreelandella sulfidaeris]|uniref:Flagellar FliJ protein n=1 Tax=Vreelandella sulfidaeris TaxID=115553 RepID=A0A455U2B5_9GAMM|nr:hypothetical protein HSBAA_01750 [Halomonas sulfidaeris]